VTLDRAILSHRLIEREANGHLLRVPRPRIGTSVECRFDEQYHIVKLCEESVVAFIDRMSVSITRALLLVTWIIL
jgi:hypothetical protein